MTPHETEERASKSFRRDAKAGLKGNSETIFLVDHNSELYKTIFRNSAAGITADTISTLSQLRRVFPDFGWTAQHIHIDPDGKYIVLKGFPGLRKTLTGTRYLPDNWKIKEMGIGVAGKKHVATKFLRRNIIFSGGEVILSAILSNDGEGAAFIFGNLCTTLLKAGLAAAIGGVVTGALLGTAAGATVVGAGPVVLAFTVGTLAAVGLETLDESIGATDKFVNALEYGFQKIDNQVSDFNREASKFYGKIERHVLYWASGGRFY